MWLKILWRNVLPPTPGKKRVQLGYGKERGESTLFGPTGNRKGSTCFYPEDERNSFLWHVGNHLHNSILPQSRQSQSILSPLLKVQISYKKVLVLAENLTSVTCDIYAIYVRKSVCVCAWVCTCQYKSVSHTHTACIHTQTSQNQMTELKVCNPFLFNELQYVSKECKCITLINYSRYQCWTILM